MTHRVSRTAAGDELLELVRDGVYRDVSVVFAPVAGGSRRVGGVTERRRVRLVRVGIVENGAYPAAEVLAVRSNLGGRDMTEPRDPEPTPEPPEPQPEPTPIGTRIARTAVNADALDALRADMLGRMTALEARAGASSAPSLFARWDSFGAYLRDASADPGAAVLLARALVDQTTTDNAAIVGGPRFIADVVGIIRASREGISAFGGAGSLGDGGMELNWPYYDGDLTTLVAKQAAEKTEIHSVKVSIKSTSAPIETFAGGSDISYQLIRRSSPSYLELYGRIMLAGWSVTTEQAFEAAILAAATGSVVYDPTAPDADGALARAAFFEASSAVKRATGSPATIALAATDVFVALGGNAGLVPPAYGTQNVAGTAQASTLRVNVSGLEVVEAPFLPDGTLLWSNGQAASWREDGPFVATAEDVAKLGQNRAIWSMGGTAVFVPAGIVKAAAA
jgi:hypothetical protein